MPDIDCRDLINCQKNCSECSISPAGEKYLHPSKIRIGLMIEQAFVKIIMLNPSTTTSSDISERADNLAKQIDKLVNYLPSN